MKISEIKVKNQNSNYSVFIGTNILKILPKKIKSISPKTNKIGIVVDSKVPTKFLIKIKKLLKNYELFIFKCVSSEKFKSYKNIHIIVEKCLKQNFNRSDILISLGGGIIGDFSAFAASIIKRGLGFINIPTTLLAQVDSSIGGKTGVNSKFGKNLIGSFYQPLLVLSDVQFLNSLSKRQMICGYAEILKHSLILDKKFFKWLDLNSNRILKNRNEEVIKKAIYRSCEIKLNVVNKDFREKNLRMILNFGHTFAHAIEVKNNYSKKITHGEAVLSGMILATKLSVVKKVCSPKTLNQIKYIYLKNNLDFTFKKYSNQSSINKLIDPKLQTAVSPISVFSPCSYLEALVCKVISVHRFELLTTPAC